MAGEDLLRDSSPVATKYFFKNLLHWIPFVSDWIRALISIKSINTDRRPNTHANFLGKAWQLGFVQSYYGRSAFKTAEI